MNRRDAVKHISILLGGTLVGANYILSGCKGNENGPVVGFSRDEIALLDEIGETILPTTKTPGAKAAQVGQFMNIMVNDSYEEKDQKAFKEGLDKIEKLSKKQFGSGFMEIKPEQRRTLLIQLDGEQKEYTKKKAEDDKKNTGKDIKDAKPAHYFRMMKELTLLGYFTSEIGSTQARRYVESPGKYVACEPYVKGQKAWA